jgi:Nucleotidyl transferase AbiEii toxin, Type IV TA system
LRLHVEALGRSQRTVLRRIAPVATPQGFYLAGGTALALLLGHRRSVDFDWFRQEPITDPLRLAANIRAGGPDLEVGRTEKGTLHGSLAGVRLSFFEYGYPLLRPVLRSPSLGLDLASAADIAAMKLAAVAQRGSRKDFVDVFALGRRFTLDEMLRLYRRKFDVREVGHVLVALSFFDDADRERMPTMLRPWKWPDIKNAIRAWVARAAAR